MCTCEEQYGSQAALGALVLSTMWVQVFPILINIFQKKVLSSFCMEINAPRIRILLNVFNKLVSFLFTCLPVLALKVCAITSQLQISVFNRTFKKIFPLKVKSAFR